MFSYPSRIIELEERGQKFLPRSDLIDPNGQSLILPETRALRVIEIRDVPDGFGILTLGLIGYLPFTKTITLSIVPKFPIQNLWTMLEVGDETYVHILPTLRRYQATGNHVPILMLARSFCYYLRATLSSGFEHTYYSRTQTGYYKPRVEFGPTISRFLSRANPIHSVSTTFDFGLNSALNRIVKAACLRFARVIPTTADWREDHNLIVLALDALQRVGEREPRGIDFDLHRAVPPRLQQQYAGMLRCYQLLVTGGGIAFTFETNGRELPSFLFNLESIFERFVRHTLVRGMRDRKIVVLNGNKHPGSLFEDSKFYSTKTDIIFKCDKKTTIGLGEVKYKPKLKEADRYQIISHVTAAKAPIGILFVPANAGEDQGLCRLGRLPTGAQFFSYRVDIQGDIETAQAKMVRDVFCLLRPP